MGVIKQLIVGSDEVVRAARLHMGKSQLERAVQHLYPLEHLCDRTLQTPAAPNPKAATFRPRRDAAVAAGLCIHEIAEDEQYTFI